MVTSILERHNKQTITMKTAAVFVLALVCVFGVALGQFGFGNQAATGGGIGGGGLLALLGLLLIFTLFTNNSSSGTGSTTIIYGNLSG